MVEKIRHGSEITSAKLNEIISAVNKMDADNKEVVKLREDLDSRLDAIYNQLEGYSEQVAEHLDTLPEVKNLYADLLRARDSADWINLAEDCTDVDAFIADALANQTEDITAQRLKIIRGTTTQITLNTPAVRDKQILLAFDPERNAGIMYMDIGNRRYPISSSEDTTITAVVPTFEFSESEGRVYLNTLVGEDVAATSPNLRGPAGEKGESGPQGPQGPRGIDGKSLTFDDLTDEQKQKLKGAKGERGVSTYIEIAYSNHSNGTNYSSNYIGQDYIGIKTYTSNDTKDSIPFKWIRFKADALYPHLDGDTLKFTKVLPASGETVEFNIRDWLNKNGGKGDRGPQGPTPIIKFTDGKGNTVEAELVETTEDPETGSTITYTYDATGIYGAKGETGEQGPKGDQGEIGRTPNIGFQTPDGSRTKLKELDSANTIYDKLYLIDYPAPEDGLFPIEANLITNSSGQPMYQFKLGRQVGGVAIHTIECPAPVGPKGDPGSAYSIKGWRESANALPQTGNPNDAYVVQVTEEETNNHVFVWLEGGTQWYDIGDTISAGSDLGSTYTLKGDLSSEEQLPESGEPNDAYIIPVTKEETINHVYVWLENESRWYNLGDTVGTKGDTGEQGRRGSSIRAYEKTPEPTGYSDVYSVTIPEHPDYLVGDIYLDTTTNDLYQITSVSKGDYNTQLNVIPLNTNVKGSQGEQGEQGVQGKYITKIDRGPVDEETRMATYTPTLYDPKTGETESGQSFQVQDGQDGADGKDGKDGTKVLTGSHEPTEDIGLVGDIYIDWLGGYIYQKTELGWGKALNSHAFNGRDGSRIFTCEYDPTTELDLDGINSIGLLPGDYMLRTTNYTLYKLSSISPDLDWENLGTLKGPEGPQGPMGQYIKALKVTVTGDSVELTMAQSTYYVLTSLSLTDITLNLGDITPETVGEFMCEFEIPTGGTTPSITIPSECQYANGWTDTDFEPGYKYVLYFLNDLIYVSYRRSQ